MRALVGLPGIKDVQVSFERASATVTYEHGKTTVDQMIAAINKAGFRASLPFGK
jgi:copper chaperone CopZ